MLKQSRVFRENEQTRERVMDSGELERERGITILAKNTAVVWQGVKINIVDTPGHSDFGGEVERALAMVDGVLVLVDAAEGPMPQTRFVLQKALSRGLLPIVVINKIDRKDARAIEVTSLTFDLMAELGASEEQLDFPILYAVAREGWASRELDQPGTDLAPLFETILAHIPPPAQDFEAPFQLQVANLDYSSYLGRLAVGRVVRGKLKKGEALVRITQEGQQVPLKVVKLFTHYGLGREEVDEVTAGDIVALAGAQEVAIGETLASPAAPEALEWIAIDEPTVSVTLRPNNGPLAGTEGQFVTSRHLRARLEREALSNVALRVEFVGEDRIKVSGRGELHLAILLEQMRREGYEVLVSRPEVITKTENGSVMEPYENLTAEIPQESLGAVMETLLARKATLTKMEQSGSRVRLEFTIASRMLFGYRSQFLSLTGGEGILAHVFAGYQAQIGSDNVRRNGSLVSMEEGEAFAYSLFKLQDRGIFYIDPGVPVYVGMVLGENNRENDLEINVTKNKKLTNVRAAGSDENIVLIPPRRLSLEEALTTLAEDELLEITPKSLRLRKEYLDPAQRRRLAKSGG